jgi:hypothetical protein
MKPFRMQNRYVLCVRMIVQARAVLVLELPLLIHNIYEYLQLLLPGC